MKELMSLENLKVFIKSKKFRKALKKSKTGKHERLPLVVKMISEMYNTKLLVEDIPLELVHYLKFGLQTDCIHYTEIPEREMLAEALKPYFNIDVDVELKPTVIKDDELYFNKSTYIDLTYFDDCLHSRIDTNVESEPMVSKDDGVCSDKSTIDPITYFKACLSEKIGPVWDFIRKEDETKFIFARKEDLATEICVDITEPNKRLTNTHFLSRRGQVADIDQTCFSRALQFLDSSDLTKEIEFRVYYRCYEGRFELVALLDENHEFIEAERFKDLAAVVPYRDKYADRDEVSVTHDDSPLHRQTFCLDTAVIVNLSTGNELMDVEDTFTYSDFSDFFVSTKYSEDDFDFTQVASIEEALAHQRKMENMSADDITDEETATIRRALENMSVKEFLDHMAKNYPENGTADSPDLF